MKCSSCVLGAVAVSLLLTACGQKGPLVLPDAPKTKRTLPQLPGARHSPAGAPAGAERPAAPSQAPDDAAPVTTPPETPATSSPR